MAPRYALRPGSNGELRSIVEPNITDLTVELAHVEPTIYPRYLIPFRLNIPVSRNECPWTRVAFANAIRLIEVLASMASARWPVTTSAIGSSAAQKSRVRAASTTYGPFGQNEFVQSTPKKHVRRVFLATLGSNAQGPPRSGIRNLRLPDAGCAGSTLRWRVDRS